MLMEMKEPKNSEWMIFPESQSPCGKVKSPRITKIYKHELAIAGELLASHYFSGNLLEVA